MKSYYNHNQFRLVGKAWEIRYYLRKLCANQQHGTTLDDHINQRRTIRLVPRRKQEVLSLVELHR